MSERKNGNEELLLDDADTNDHCIGSNLVTHVEASKLDTAHHSSHSRFGIVPAWPVVRAEAREANAFRRLSNGENRSEGDNHRKADCQSEM